MADDPSPRVLNPYSAFSGPLAGSDKDFSMNPQRVDHRHPAVASAAPVVETPAEAAQEAAGAPQGIAPDAEPLPTPQTPTPRPDGQPPAPDAVVPVIATSRSENSTVAVVSQTEGSAPTTS